LQNLSVLEMTERLMIRAELLLAASDRRGPQWHRGHPKTRGQSDAHLGVIGPRQHWSRRTMPDIPDEAGLFGASLDQADMPQEEKSFVRSLLWTGEEVPSISSAEQYEFYARQADALKQRYDSAPSLEFLRSTPGMLYAALTARLIEWEEQNAR
jgi:hypothetical protein